MITHYPLPWWIKRLDSPTTLARFGDGEFLCIQGRGGENSHGCSYTPELKADLVSILEEKDTNFLKGMQRILPSQFREVRPMLKGTWVDTELFGDLMAAGEMKPFFDLLRKRNVVIISSKEKRSFSFYEHFIETPRTNTHAERERIIEEVLKYGKPYAYLFACGMAAGPLVHRLHGKINGATLMDIGHILDPFCDEGASREYLKNVPNEVISRNL
jgi:hypothetical protein